MILEVGVDIETKAGGGRTPLYSGSRHDQSKIVRALLLRSARQYAPLNTATLTVQNQQSQHAATEATRAMEHTNSWKPPVCQSRQSRQSWNIEDQKHDLQICLVNDHVGTRPGFTERT
ncbi:hypothetical protein VDGL01_12076 [Verticillium dahliae]